MTGTQITRLDDIAARLDWMIAAPDADLVAVAPEFADEIKLFELLQDSV